MTVVHGFCDPEFRTVSDLLARHIDDGDEVGASIAVYHGSKKLIDIWAGFADASKCRAWNRDTIANIWSSTKTISALSVLICHDRGLLSVFDPVSKYWPEFASAGKGRVLVRHLMSHTSGLAFWEDPLSLEQVYDVRLATERLASQAPAWEPGSASGYHGQTFGQLLGELVRRVSGKSLTEFVRTEIAEPLGADIQIGALEDDWPRIAELVPPPSRPARDVAPVQDSFVYKMLMHPPIDVPATSTPGWRRAELGAINGHSNAGGLARALAVISTGGMTSNGHRFLEKETIDLIFESQAEGKDLVLGLPVRFGIGFGINTDSACQEAAPFMPPGRVAFWGGNGGSMCIMDTDHNVTVTYVMNKMGTGTLGNQALATYVVEIYRLLQNQGIVGSHVSLNANTV